MNGSIEVGQTAHVLLAGDATELLKPSVRDELEGIGIPPFRELMAKARSHEVPVYV